MCPGSQSIGQLLFNVCVCVLHQRVCIKCMRGLSDVHVFHYPP